MPKFVIFKGKEARNQGRFGLITPGTPLVLTDAEWDGVKDSGDFSYNPNPEQASDDPNIAQKCDPKVIDALELREKSSEQLYAYIDQLKGEGVNIQCARNLPRKLIIRAIELALNAEQTPDEEIPDDETTAQARAQLLAARERFIEGLAGKSPEVAEQLLEDWDKSNGVDAEALEKEQAERAAAHEQNVEALREKQNSAAKAKAEAARAAAEAKAKDEEPVSAADVPPSNAEAVKLNGKTKPQLIEIYTATFGEAPESTMTKAELVVALVEKAAK